MELEELKHLWQSHTATLEATDHHSQVEIGKILRQRSRKALANINRSIAIEVGLLLIFAVVAFWQLWQTDASWHLLASIMLGFIAASLLFYGWKYRKLNQSGLESANLKEALSSTTKTMAGYMRLYSYAGMILVPLLGAGGVLYGVYHAAAEEGQTLADFDPIAWVVISTIILIYSGLSILFTRWYVRKLYGIHYEELKSCLLELEEVSLS